MKINLDVAGEGKEVADWKCPILSLHMGRATVRFLSGAGVEGEEVVDVEAVGFGRKAEVRESFLSPAVFLLSSFVFFDRFGRDESVV
jgi:hypothetical protein